jgi:ribokinase
MAIARDLQGKGAATVIVKLGDAGCVLVPPGEKGRHIPAPKVNAIDTTAAGDVFNAALAVALSDGANLPAACHFANHAAALSVTRMGAQISAPTRAEVEAALPTTE